MDESKYEDSMQIIMYAGTAKSCALLAAESAENGDFDAAQEQMEQANKAMESAHDLQFSLISAEASGNPVDVNVLLVHAQDHLSMAITAIDYSTRLIALYRRLEALEKGSDAAA